MSTNGVNGIGGHTNGISHTNGEREVNGVGKRPIRIAGCSGGKSSPDSSLKRFSLIGIGSDSI